MMCLLCSKAMCHVMKVVKGTPIYKCTGCQLGAVDQSRVFFSLEQIAVHYNPSEYQKQEKKLSTYFKKFISKIVNLKREGSVLDIGGGYGLFSFILAQKGKYAIDILEPVSEQLYGKTLKNIYYIRSSFEDYFKKTHKKYDVIVLMDVIEHFRNPLENLEQVHKLLKDDGIILIQTPNYISLMAKLCTDWAWWMIEDHKFFFSLTSLQLLLQKAGFNITYQTTYEDFIDFKKNLDGNFCYINNGFIRKIVKSIFFSFFIPFYFLLRRLLWAFGFGGLLLVTARRAN